MPRVKEYAVAASGRWTDEEEGRRRLPAGEVHAWEPCTNQTVCGLSLRAGRRGGDTRPRWHRTNPRP
ncbi:hypothetical protein [Streptomyces sp. SAI-144]|uniref:hypothetical protein n=1 Tax=Streptomyces sp. SAI-144 TaxID=2940544 RepID=UPI002474FCD3|nr:hypothetical protein [Streptomyces sp. SAI-144]